jgi:anhydro-N-acetylmuramic acid kinase
MTDDFQVIGLMSGTSLDGVDLACCTFSMLQEQWSYKILAAQTIPYTNEWRSRLQHLIHADAVQYVNTHAMLGRMYAAMLNEFISSNQLQPALIASHGHTIFHQPAIGFTSQIGEGAQIAALTGVDTVCDFRTKDVALGGQGAPLVPFGEQLLFPQYRCCLNLGGIANITFNDSENAAAFDICPANMALNEAAQATGKNYDEGGKLAASGKIIPQLLEKLNGLDYYHLHPPKSLGREWYEKNFRPVMNEFTDNIPDLLFTLCSHIGEQIAKGINRFPLKSTDGLLITGGGAFNKTLLACIQKNVKLKITVPDVLTISYKEALIFALLGFLYIKEKVNISNAVTGSLRSHTGGALYRGN